jgi:hypothetical protein
LAISGDCGDRCGDISAVDVGSVEKDDAGVESGVHDRETARFVGEIAEVHGAQADPADP